MMLTKAELDDMWENQPYGAYARWKRKHRLELKEYEKTKNYSDFECTVQVFEKIIADTYLYKFKAPTYDAAVKKQKEYLEKTRLNVEKSGEWGRYTYNSNVKRVI